MHTHRDAAVGIIVFRPYQLLVWFDWMPRKTSMTEKTRIVTSRFDNIGRQGMRQEVVRSAQRVWNTFDLQPLACTNLAIYSGRILFGPSQSQPHCWFRTDHRPRVSISKDITDPSLYASAHNGSYTVICIPCCLRMNRLETFTSHRLSTYVPNMNATTCHSYAPLPKLVSVSWSQKGLDRLRYLLVAEIAIGIAITSFQPLNKHATPDRGFIR